MICFNREINGVRKRTSKTKGTPHGEFHAMNENNFMHGLENNFISLAFE